MWSRWNRTSSTALLAVAWGMGNPACFCISHGIHLSSCCLSLVVHTRSTVLYCAVLCHCHACCRRVSLRLAAVLQSRDETAACQLVTECEHTTRLGWVRDPDSGGYPAHIAAWHGLGAFLQQLVERDGEHLSDSGRGVNTDF